MAREGIILRCTVCKMENYITKVDKKKQEGKLEVTKFCPKCNKHTLHRQKK